MFNQLKTILFLGVLSVLLVALGGAIGGRALPVFAVIAVAINVLSFLYSDRLVLRMSGARLVDATEAPALHAMVAELAERAGIPQPRLAIVPDPTPNAFATGRSPSRAVVAVTEGLLRLVDARELRGVLAHELAHVRNRDTLIATVAAAAATAISWIAHSIQWAALFGGAGRSAEDEADAGHGGLLAAIFAPIAATLLQLGISRSREFHADATAARLTGDPLGLASALQRLQAVGEQLAARGAPEPTPATASLAIVNPFRGRSLFRLFATHPPLEDRIARLQALAAELRRSA